MRTMIIICKECLLENYGLRLYESRSWRFCGCFGEPLLCYILYPSQLIPDTIKPGQVVTCINPRGWRDEQGVPIKGPKLGDRVTVAELVPQEDNEPPDLRFAEYPKHKTFPYTLFQ